MKQQPHPSCSKPRLGELQRHSLRLSKRCGISNPNTADPVEDVLRTMWNEIDGSISSDSTVIKTKCKRELSKLNSKVLSNAEFVILSNSFLEYVRQIKEEKRRSEVLW
ncbi:hypothetical protein T06_5352 [Trichinella sp. T6]|nr:hypothetical protein T06_11958 [Trichinella sp. T6]KRX77191.1 hypothetical protein T06_5352 [Trichinella sp. T6]